MRRMSLRLRLSIGVTAVVLATSLGLATAALYFVKRHMQESIAQEQFARMSALADAVDQKFISRRALLRNFSVSVETLHLPDAAGLQRFLVAHEKSLRGSFDNVSVLSLQGDLVANLNGAGAIGKVNGAVEQRAAFLDAVRKTVLTDSPLGRPVRLDDYGNPIYDVYIRKVVKNKDGKYWNVPIQTYEHVSQFWKYDPETYMKQPPYSRDFQGIKS